MKCFSACIAAVALTTSLALPLQDAEDEREYVVREDMRIPVEASNQGVAQPRGLLPSRTWPKGVVPYVIGNFSIAERTIIHSLLNEIGRRTCVRFVQRTNQKTYLDIFSGDGCWSVVGYNAGATNQKLSLQSPGCVTRPITFHEVLHALGFVHEQDREDRDYFLAIQLDNAKPDENGLMKIYDTVSLGVPFNVKSAMLYSPMDFSVNCKQVMVSTRPHHPIGNTGIPWSDWRRVNRLYNCPPSYEEALDKLEF